MPPTKQDEVHLLVNGLAYSGWTSIRITRSIESLSGSFHLEASDRWAAQGEAWPIAEEDLCEVVIGSETAIWGYVERRSISISSDQRTLTYYGRDAAGQLTDGSAILEHWEFEDMTVLELARKVCDPLGIGVSLAPGIVLRDAKGSKVAINPGDSPWTAIQAAALSAGVLVVSDGQGGLLITRSGTQRLSTPLKLGDNILSIDVTYDATERFRRYVVATQIPGTDHAFGEATKVWEEAIDEGVRRTGRNLLIQPAGGINAKDARRRADWEARTRAAQAEAFTVAVLGWRSGDTIWPLNALVHVHAPAAGVVGDLLISQVEHVISSAGKLSYLRLVRPDAFDPEPQAVVRDPARLKHVRAGAKTGIWKEIAGGTE